MDALEIIGAFVDRERVDPEALKAALATEEGRQYLVDIAMLREITAEQPTAAAITRVDRRRPRFAWAATIAAAVLGGYVAGRTIAADLPVQPDAVVSAPVPLSTPAIPAPPPPTNVIFLESGVDWHEGAGS